ncbi:unnamed protein product, partial [Polarella glacialis]
MAGLMLGEESGEAEVEPAANSQLDAECLLDEEQVQREREESLARTQKARDLIQEQETVLKNIYLKLALGDAEGHGSSGAHAPSAAGHGGSLYRSSASWSASSFHEASTFEQQARKVGELIEQREDKFASFSSRRKAKEEEVESKLAERQVEGQAAE